LLLDEIEKIVKEVTCKHTDVGMWNRTLELIERERKAIEEALKRSKDEIENLKRILINREKRMLAT